MSRFAERFHEKGLQQGIHQGEALVLERQLRLKFGTLPDAVQRRIEQANEQTLLAWSRAGSHRQSPRRGSTLRVDRACRL